MEVSNQITNQFKYLTDDFQHVAENEEDDSLVAEPLFKN